MVDQKNNIKTKLLCLKKVDCKKFSLGVEGIFTKFSITLNCKRLYILKYTRIRRMLVFQNDSLKTRCNTMVWVKKNFKNVSASCHTSLVKNRASFCPAQVFWPILYLLYIIMSHFHCIGFFQQKCLSLFLISF